MPGSNTRRPSRRLIRARRQWRAGLAQLPCGLAGLALGFALPQIPIGPTVDGANLTEPLFTLGLGVVGVVSIVFALLSLQLAYVLVALTSRGRAVIADVYPPRITDAVGRRAAAPAHRTVRRTSLTPPHALTPWWSVASA
jgi:hypothetical protein